MIHNLKQAGIEPTLHELLQDPAMTLLLRFDGLDTAAVRQVMREALQSFAPPYRHAA